MSVYERAAAAGAISPAMVLHWSTLAAGAGDAPQGTEVILRRGVELHPTSADLWLRLLASTHQLSLLAVGEKSPLCGIQQYHTFLSSTTVVRTVLYKNFIKTNACYTKVL